MGKILIVDDALFMREVISGVLRSGGYDELVEAEDGEAALRVFADERPELVILDITMPRVSGIETLRQIKALDGAAKVIICSAIGQEKQMMNAIALGAADYIVKPFKPENLMRVVVKVLGQR